MRAHASSHSRGTHQGCIKHPPFTDAAAWTHLIPNPNPNPNHITQHCPFLQREGNDYGPNQAPKFYTSLCGIGLGVIDHESKEQDRKVCSLE
ncbi:unnamed protein product [Sphenostylis stenocarpa]|uniref:Uncharacterized protein n=1 Tax=Sphenostylis stenocarpa TaxID=92480 RepID=A0AA86SJ28_9FABA|nr:unnamed protein product [Sphenostylis stenocarpa]